MSAAEDEIKHSEFVLRDRYEPVNLEEVVRKYWESVALKELLRKRESKKVIGWVEGPPTLNGLPHVGHVRGRLIKDLWHRFENMKGTKVIFNGGWDTQGLPVELEAEKELGLTGSKIENLRAVGEEKLVEACKSLIKKYHGFWLQCDRLLGLQMDDENAYWTYKDEYIEREWKYLEAAYKRGLLGEGFKVVPYCPSCQTSLSHEEVGLGYEQVEDPSVYYKAKLADRDAYLLIWTTMPFTVITDELVGVHPEEYYVEVLVRGERWIIAEKRLSALKEELGLNEEAEIVSRKKGKELEGLRYIPPLLEEVPWQAKMYEQGKVHFVVAEEFVDITTGSGLVHLAPANGEEDYEVARKRGLPVFNPFDDSCIFTEEAGSFAGSFARDTDEVVLQLLEKKGLLVKAGRLTHEYPLCWRSGHRLIYMARREYFYWIDRIVDLTTKAAENVEYYYDAPRNRFLNIIKEGRPWNITRERVWGAPLPVWVCKDCNNKNFVFSRKDILERAIELPDGPGFELHRPWIDRVVIKCEKCGGKSYREPFVLDTWHNSGAAPYAGLGEDEYKKRVPVPFLTEGIDQTRGWAYTLLVENVLFTGEPQAPYSAFLFQGHVLDAKGEKMSKSKGNYVGGLDALTRNSVDMLRYYMLWKASPAEPISYIEEEMLERPFQVLNTLYHLHVYYSINSEFDNYKLSKDWISRLKSKGGDVTERWLLSKLNSLVKKTRRSLEERRFQEAARAIEEFLIDTLSQKYVPATRSILWDDSEAGREKRYYVYTAMGHSLEVCDRLLHPFTPFITEYLHKAIFLSDEPLMLLEYPEAEETLIDVEMEKSFEGIWQVLSLSNSARMKAGLKRRWPVRTLFYHGERLPESIEELLKELANVKQVSFVEDISSMPVRLKVKLSKEAARRVGRKFNLLLNYLQQNTGELFKQMQKESSVDVELEGEKFSLSREDVTFEVESKEGFSSSYGSGYIVSIDTSRDKELIAEGVVRDVARRFQALRKKRGYRPTDLLPVATIAGLDEETKKMISERRDELLFLVRAKELQIFEERDTSHMWEESDLDGRTIYIDIQTI